MPFATCILISLIKIHSSNLPKINRTNFHVLNPNFQDYQLEEVLVPFERNVKSFAFFEYNPIYFTTDLLSSFSFLWFWLRIFVIHCIYFYLIFILYWIEQLQYTWTSWMWKKFYFVKYGLFMHDEGNFSSLFKDLWISYCFIVFDSQVVLYKRTPKETLLFHI